MLKNITIVSLLLFIFLVGTFSFFFLAFHTNIPALNSVNESTRRTFRRNRVLRSLFRLADRGDARNDYYQPNPFSKLKFEIYFDSEQPLFPGSITLIKNDLKNVLNKPGGISVVGRDLGNVPLEVDNKDLSKLVDYAVDYSADTAVVRIYVLSYLKGFPDILGQTIGAYGFAVFKQSLDKNETDKNIARDLEKEVILHEIGHLLGAEHISNLDCVMSPYVDSNDTFTLTFTPTEYCPADLSAIKEANY